MIITNSAAMTMRINKDLPYLLFFFPFNTSSSTTSFSDSFDTDTSSDWLKLDSPTTKLLLLWSESKRSDFSISCERLGSDVTKGLFDIEYELESEEISKGVFEHEGDSVGETELDADLEGDSVNKIEHEGDSVGETERDGEAEGDSEGDIDAKGDFDADCEGVDEGERDDEQEGDSEGEIEQEGDSEGVLEGDIDAVSDGVGEKEGSGDFPKGETEGLSVSVGRGVYEGIADIVGSFVTGYVQNVVLVYDPITWTEETFVSMNNLKSTLPP